MSLFFLLAPDPTPPLPFPGPLAGATTLGVFATFSTYYHTVPTPTDTANLPYLDGIYHIINVGDTGDRS